jgi:hypothetical protein
MAHDRYIDGLVAAAKELFAKGINDPSAEQIVSQYWGEDKPVQRVMVDDAAKKLSRVRLVLDQEGFQTCPVTERYYRRSRTERIRGFPDAATARQYLPNSSGQRRQFGLVRLLGDAETDVLWREWQALRNGMWAGTGSKRAAETASAFEAGRVDEHQVDEIMASAETRLTPSLARLHRSIEREEVPALLPGSE